MEKEMLRLEHVSKAFSGVRALTDYQSYIPAR